MSQGPPDSSPAPLTAPPPYLQPLEWVSSFRYLGFPIHRAPDPGGWLSCKVDFDRDTANKRLFGTRTLFRNPAHQPLKTDILQVVYANALYPTANADIDYDLLDTWVNNFLRNVFNPPLQTSSTYIRRELGLRPSMTYAHPRTLRFAWKLYREHWTRLGFNHLSSLP